MRINTLIVAAFALLGLVGPSRRPMRRLLFRLASLLRPCPSILSLPSLAPITSGRQAIGDGTPMLRTITGCRGRGLLRRVRGCCGHLDIGAGAMARTSGTPAIGAPPWAFTGAYPMVSATRAWVLQEDIGPADRSSITSPLRISVTRRSSITSTARRLYNNHMNNVSYNGGNGGIKAQPTQQELQAANEHHIAQTTSTAKPSENGKPEQGAARFREQWQHLRLLLLQRRAISALIALLPRRERAGQSSRPH